MSYDEQNMSNLQYGDQPLPPQENVVASDTENLQQEPQKSLVEQTHVSPQETSPAESWRQLRDKAERAERERDELYRKVQEIESSKQAISEDYEIGIGNDDIAEGKHLKKIQKEVKELREQIKTFHKQTAEQTAEARLKSQYPDYDAVVSKDNIELLRTSYPQLINTLIADKDPYSQAVSAYTMIKNMNIIPTTNNYQTDRDKVLKNASKPRPLTSIAPQQGDSPLSHANAFANGLTPELQQQLWKEMNHHRKAY